MIAQRQPVGLGRALFAGLMVFVLEQLALFPFGDIDQFHPQVTMAVAVAVALFTFLGNGLAMRTCFELAFANRRRQWPAFGVACPPWREGWIGPIACTAMGFVALEVGGIVTQALGLEHGTTNIPTVDKSAGFGLLAAVIAIGVAPWAEEIAFRGFLFSGLERRIHPLLAALLSSAAWAAAHGVWAVLIPFTLLGMALCWLRSYTGSILPGVGLHAALNATVSAFGGATLDPVWSILVFLPMLGTVVATAAWARQR